MSVTGAPVSCTFGRVSANGIILRMASFTASPEGGDLDSTNYEGGGFPEGLVGLTPCGIEFEGFYDMS
jgi:hypothetical protein